MTETFMAAFAGGFLGAAWLPIFILAFIFIECVFSNDSNPFWGIVTFVLGLFVLNWAFAIPVWTLLLANPFNIIGFILGYGLIGFIYGNYWRFPNCITKKAPAIASYFDSWKTYGGNESKTFEDFVESSEYASRYAPSSNVGRIFNWITLWPFAIIHELSYKPFTWVYNNIGKIMEETGKKTALKNYKK